VARRLLKWSAAGADSLRRRPGTTVLIYHRVGGRTGVEIDLPLALFDEQMEALAAMAGTATLNDAIDGLERADGSSAIVVTFDDGTSDFVDVALPILVRHGIPATLYVATAFVEEQRPFPDDGMPLSWDALVDALSTGLVTIGSHTHTHALLDRVDVVTASEELDRSIRLIEDRLGISPEHFAYPKALLGTRPAQEAVRARFRSAAVAGTRANIPGRTDPYRLARSPVQVSDGMRWWRHKVDGGMRLEDDVRRLVYRRRYAGART
jgi:peptidoglycan/xylan/chitin deacetylase (PgdA/CDA1 family)